MLKILVVDDENLVRVALRSMVNWEEHGFDFAGTAGDGIEAIAMVEKYEPDIVITDLKMPGMDGIQLIKSLNERQFKGKILVLSNYSEFELVKQALMLGAVDYILKVTLIADDFIALLKNIGGALHSEREMKHKLLNDQVQLAQSKSILINNFFKELFNEETVFDYQRITLAAQNAGLKPALAKCIMYYIQVDEYEKAFGGSKTDDRKQLAFSMRNIISEYLNKSDEVRIIEVDYRRLVVIIPEGEFRLLESPPEKAADKIAGQFKLYLNIEVSIVVSTEFEGFYGAKTMYGNCVKAIKQKFYDGNGSILRIETIKSGKTTEKINYAAEISKIMALIESGTLGEVVLFVKMMGENAKKEGDDPVNLKKHFLRLIEGIELEIAKSAPITEPAIESLKEQIDNTETMADFLLLATELLSRIDERGKKDGIKNYRKEVNEVIRFINDNYRRKITIAMIAGYVNLNESYICRVFKNETHKSIFTYITEVRMEKAAALLRDKNLPIKDIAYEVGIDDQFYFNRVFKKYFGVNPTNFKKSKESL